MKQLVPLGFTRSDIRKVNEGGDESATLKLLAQQSEAGEGSASDSEEGGVIKQEKREEGGKAFVIKSVQVSTSLHLIQKTSLFKTVLFFRTKP